MNNLRTPSATLPRRPILGFSAVEAKRRVKWMRQECLLVRCRRISLAASRVCLLIGLGSCTEAGSTLDTVMVPAAVAVRPWPDPDYWRPVRFSKSIEVKAHASNDDPRPWVLHGIRLWEDTGKPCLKLLQAGLCQHGSLDADDKETLTCIGRPYGIRQQDPTTGEFEITGQGASVVFVGVGATAGTDIHGNFWDARGTVGQAALVPLNGGERHDLLLYCKPRGAIRVQVVEANGRVFEADGEESSERWRFDIWAQGYPRRRFGYPLSEKIAEDVPAGWPVWVRVFRDGTVGMWKQVVIEADVLNTVTFCREPGPPTVLKGRVTNQDTLGPLQRVWVAAEIISDTSRAGVMTETDVDGRYSLELAPGTWRISFKVHSFSRTVAVAPGRVLAPGTWTFDVALANAFHRDNEQPPDNLDPFPEASPTE